MSQDLAQIQQLCKARDIVGLQKKCEDMEIHAAITQTQAFYSYQLFAYLINDELDRARLLWKRVPEQLKNKASTDLSNTWLVADCMLESKRREALNLLKSRSWGDLNATLATILIDVYRERNANLLARAYSKAAVEKAADFLGLSPVEAVQYLVSRRWTVDAANQFATPPKTTTERQQIVASSQLITTLASQVLFVDK